MRGRRPQSGVALLTAIILVAIATMIAAAIAFNTAMTARRGTSVINFEQALQYVGGAEAYAAKQLLDQATSNPNNVRGDEDWARAVGPVEVAPGVQVQAQLIDLSGRFNLNSLVDENGKKNQKAYDVFLRLLGHLDVDAGVADKIVDWIDADNLPEPYGAEDNIYTSESPPYRPPNMAITSVSELRALKDLTSTDYDRLKDQVVALPRSGKVDATPINLCTASPALIDALFNSTQFTNAPLGLQIMRKNKCWPTLPDFQNKLEQPDIEKAIGLGNQSQYFRLTTLVSIGTSKFALYSFLLRTNGATGGSQVVVLSRSATE